MTDTTTPCARCGSFFPSAQLNLDDLCAACQARAMQAMPKLGTRSMLARLGLSGLSVSYLLLAVGFLLAGNDKHPLLMARALVGLFALAALPLAVVGTLVWIHLAVRRAQALGAYVSASPGWAVGSFFVPIAQMAIPFAVGRDLLRQAGRSPHAATAWQVLWLGGGVVQIFAMFTPGNVAAQVLTNLIACAGSAMCVIVISQVGLLEPAAAAVSARAPQTGRPPAPADAAMIPPAEATRAERRV
jgi:hypothetical protein